MAWCASLPLLAQEAAQQKDPWTEKSLMQPKDLAALLAGPADSRPMLIHVGFPVLYRNAHIPGSVYAGPGAKPEGLAELKKAVANVPKDREIVLYCGCCPMNRCPNLRPSFQQLSDAGYSRVRVLVIPTNLHTDWVTKGYPIEKPSA